MMYDYGEKPLSIFERVDLHSSSLVRVFSLDLYTWPGD